MKKKKKSGKTMRFVGKLVLMSGVFVAICGIAIAILLISTSKKPTSSSVAATTQSSFEAQTQVSTPAASSGIPSESNSVVIIPNGAAASEAASAPSVQYPSINKLVFVGDSRYYGMSIYADSSDVFICDNGVGIDFLLAKMNDIIAACDEHTALILGMGVNDCSMLAICDDYLKAIEKLRNSIPSVMFVQTILPVDENREAAAGFMYVVTNKSVDEYNKKLFSELPGNVLTLDYRDYLNENGYETYDGLHFSAEDYERLYKYLHNFIYKTLGQ